jgi:uncharacterized protein (TIGR03437 family)
VPYEYGANLSPVARGGFIDVNDVSFVIDQPAASCDVSLDQERAVFGAAGSVVETIRVSTFADCAWTATSSVPWLSVARGASGTGSGTVDYSVAANPSATLRKGSLLIGNKSFEVQQAAANCNVSLGGTTAQVAAEGGERTLAITANCSWNAVAGVGWIRITSAVSGSADAALAYTVAPNSAAEPRRGTITVNGQTLTITQAGQTCSLTVSPLQAGLPARGGGGEVNVRGNTACSWSAVSGAEWLKVEWSSVSGAGVVRYAAAVNNSGAERATSIQVSGQTVAVRQPPLVLTVTPQSILNAASFAGGAVAPGEMVTIFGTGFGPVELAGLQLDATGQAVTGRTGDTQVFFDGQAAPMIYSIEGQISAVVPYGIAGRQNVQVEIQYLGVHSNMVTVPVSPTAPGVFTLAASGRGPAAVLNQDSTLNGADNRAARGSALQIFATGEGQTRPRGVDGRLALGSAALPVPVLPVTVLIGGMEARVLYAGAAPGLVAGVMQVNAVVPESVQPGPDVPVVIRVGEVQSPPGPTVAVW